MCDTDVQRNEEIVVNGDSNNNIADTATDGERVFETDENSNQITTTKRKSWLKCDVCNIPLSSANLVDRHLAGKRHLANIKRITEKYMAKKLYCELCKVKTNGTKQLQDHLMSAKHKGRMEKERKKLESRRELKYKCFFGIIIATVIFVIVSNIFHAMFLYTQSL